MSKKYGALPRSASKETKLHDVSRARCPSSAGVWFGTFCEAKKRRHPRDAINATYSHQGVGEPSRPKRPCASEAVRI